VAAVVDPPSLTFAEGETKSYTVTFSTTDTTGDEWRFGSLTWSDGGGHSVRSPIAVRPVALAAPEEIEGTGVEGKVAYDVTFGYTGPFTADPHGLQAAITHDDNVVDDPADDINVAYPNGPGVDIITIDVAADVEHLRAALYDENTDGEDDLDLYLFDPNGEFVDGSGSVTSAEQVDAPDPMPGDWTVVVHGWETDGPDANYTLFSWLLTAADAGNMTVTEPAAAVLGQEGEVTVAWSGLATATRYLGYVGYTGIGGADIGRTFVSIVT
jgi:hypothetical protein